MCIHQSLPTHHSSPVSSDFNPLGGVFGESVYFNFSQILTQDLLKIDRNIFFGGTSGQASSSNPAGKNGEMSNQADAVGEDEFDEPAHPDVDNLGHPATQHLDIGISDDHPDLDQPSEAIPPIDPPKIITNIENESETKIQDSKR